jgi:hypothetical protein
MKLILEHFFGPAGALMIACCVGLLVGALVSVGGLILVWRDRRTGWRGPHAWRSAITCFLIGLAIIILAIALMPSRN